VEVAGVIFLFKKKFNNNYIKLKCVYSNTKLIPITMKSTVLLTRLVALVFVISFAISCKKDNSLDSVITPTNNTNTSTPSNNYTPPAVAFFAPIQGFVVGEAGNPIANAEVKTGNKTAKTDANGYFRIEQAPFTGDFCYIKAVKNGYFTGSVTVHGKSGGNYMADMVLMDQNNKQTFAATQGKTITLQSGAEVKLPSNGYINSAGKAYTGNVNVAIAYLNPEAKNFSSLIPGGDLRAYDANGKNMQLYSYGMLNVEMRDDGGNLLQLAQGKKATLTMPVGTTMAASAPTTIPLWYFDEVKGIWIEEGSATLQGGKYVGTVSHFTPWNCDRPAPPSKIMGKVVDYKGIPIKFAKVRVDQKVVCVDDKGVFVAQALANSQVSIDIYDETTGELRGVGLTVYAPAPDQLKDVGNIALKDASNIKANVTDCKGQPFNGYGFIKYGNYTKKVLVTNGDFSVAIVNIGGQAELTFVSEGVINSVTKKVNIPNVAQPVDVGDVLVCGKNGLVNRISFTYQLGNNAPVKVSYLMPPIAYCTAGSTFSNIIFSDASDKVTKDFTYQIVFSFNGELPGTYTMVTKPYIGFIYYMDNNFEAYIYSAEMELVIDKLGKRGEVVSGTFSGDAKNKNGYPITITDGSFETVRTY
jgi:hypothetical protein